MREVGHHLQIILKTQSCLQTAQTHSHAAHATLDLMERDILRAMTSMSTKSKEQKKHKNKKTRVLFFLCSDFFLIGVRFQMVDATRTPFASTL
jgi:hypothetical protein